MERRELLLFDLPGNSVDMTEIVNPQKSVLIQLMIFFLVEISIQLI